MAWWTLPSRTESESWRRDGDYRKGSEVTAQLEATIVQWDKPEDGWLKIVVTIEPLGVRDSFYRVSNRDTGEWGWFQWSMAGKPTVKVSPQGAKMLSLLVANHGVLNRLLDCFGLAEPKASD